MGIKDVGGDEHYGTIGFGGMGLSAADTFSIAQLPVLAEPTLIVDLKTGRKVNIEVEEILVWDIAEWLAFQVNNPTLAGLENAVLEVNGGITKDNTASSTDFPVADSSVEGTQPGGNGTAQVGNITGTARMIGETAPRFEARFEWINEANEENAAGEINHSLAKLPKRTIPNYSPYNQDGVWVYNLMTAAHYWFWANSTNFTGTATFRLGARVKKVAVGVDELLFDREVLFSLVDALAFQSG